MYDIVIVGAGPAGATAARYLKKGYKVLLLDKRDLDQEANGKREICCGGLLAPDAQKMLAHLGLGVPKDVIVGPQMFSVQSVDYDNHLIRHYQRHYININRELFDRWLVSYVPNHVTKEFGAIYMGLKEVKHTYIVKYRIGKQVKEVKTKYVIGADGAHSRVRNKYFHGKTMPESYVSIQKWYESSGRMPYYVSFFDQNVTDFYSWIIQKENKLLIGTAIPIESYHPSIFDKLETDAKKTGYKVGECEKVTGSLIMRTRNLKQINTSKNRVFLIGEAAGLISPSSSEGISYALKSGEKLARVMNKSLYKLNKRYELSLLDIKFNLLFKNFKSFLMYNKTFRKLIMRSRVMSMKIRE